MSKAKSPDDNKAAENVLPLSPDPEGTEGDLPLGVLQDYKAAIDQNSRLVIDNVPENYQLELEKFLTNFIETDPYARQILTLKESEFDGDNTKVLKTICDIYEATGIDLMKEAFYQYWKVYNEMPPFYKQGIMPDLRCVYNSDPRLHSRTDSTLGAYIDDWRDMTISDEEQFWCEIAENIRPGLSEDLEAQMVEQFVARIRGLDPQPDMIILAPSSDPTKQIESYQMFSIGQKVHAKTGIPYLPDVMKRNRAGGRVEQFQDEMKYFPRRNLGDGAFEVDPAKVEEKSVLILDDGWSSGATLDELKKVLYTNKTKNVYSLHLVRC